MVQDYITGQQEESHAGMTTLLYLLIISPDSNFNSFLACNSLTMRNNLMIFGNKTEQMSVAVACRNDNSTCIHFVIISPDP